MKIEKTEKLIANLPDKTEYVIYIKKLSQALIHGLVLKKVDRFIKFNQKAYRIIYWFEHWVKKNKNKKWLWRRLFQAGE